MTEALIALFGTAITALIAYLGHKFNLSIQDRTLLLQKGAEERLRVETALKAVELISGSEKEGRPNSTVVRSSIFMLRALGQERLALSIAEQYWLDEVIEIRFFNELIDHSIRYGDTSLRELSLSYIINHPKKFLDSDGGFHFPEGLFLKWDESIVKTEEVDIRNAFIEIMLSRPFKEWKSRSINQFIYYLYKSFDSKDAAFAFISARFIKSIVNGSGMDLQRTFRPPDIPKICVKDILDKSKGIIEQFGDPYGKVLEIDYHRADKICEWAKSD